MSARILLALALSCSTCTALQPSPAPAPVPAPIPDGGDDDDAAPVPTPAPVPAPDSTCAAVVEHLADLECPAAGGRDAFLTACASFSSSALSCLLATDTCVVARACLEK